MTRKDLGLYPVGPKDQLTLAWARATYPSYSNYIAAEADCYIGLPEDPVEHQMEIFEITATGPERILVFSPDNVRPCLGTHPSLTLEAGKTVFFGYRYSMHAGVWFLLSTALEA